MSLLAEVAEVNGTDGTYTSVNCFKSNYSNLHYTSVLVSTVIQLRSATAEGGLGFSRWDSI